jgi:signal transduction histidine kinase
MDNSKEGLLLIGTSMVVLTSFVIAVAAVMIIYRKRRIEHNQEIKTMNEKFTRELLQTQLEVQQQTMHHIGRELHDNIGQQLTLAFLYTQQFSMKDEGMDSQIQTVATIINKSLTDLRSLSKNLTDSTLAGIELTELIQYECAKVQSFGLCDVQFMSVVKEINASEAVKNFLLRIVQEFLQNSLKHSACTVIEVHIDLADQYLELLATDNGKGFDLNSTAPHNGIGLRNIRNRAEMIQADLILESAPLQGTRMKLSIPFHKLN